MPGLPPIMQPRFHRKIIKGGDGVIRREKTSIYQSLKKLFNKYVLLE